MALTNFPGTVSRKKMGRPPLKVRETKVRLTEEQRRAIEELVGQNRMSAFIREAIDAEIIRRRQELGLSAATDTVQVRAAVLAWEAMTPEARQSWIAAVEADKSDDA
ncbi:hypothetical protein [Afifella sp. YEN Y35]|uniref:hypothetical protein n=1 Tax=Afifella sp. YEN Y35 TaxID=3388337 RepID=UPI0039DFFD57